MSDERCEYDEEIMVVLGILTECQAQAAPIRITIGEVRNGIVRHDAVLIHDAPARVVETLVRKLYGVSVVDGALRISVKPFGQS